MKLLDKNIIHTFIPPENGWKYDKDFYLIDLYCLCLSVCLVRKNLNVKTIKLYTTPEIMEFFKGTTHFDELININTIDSIDEIDWTKNKYNTLYKLFVCSVQEEPFIHIDHDLFILDGKIFDDITTNYFFAFKENFSVPFYQFYPKIINQIEGSTPNINDYAFNCCLFGSNSIYLKNTFSKARDLLIEKYDEFVFIDKVDCYLEQYYQVKELLNLVDEKDVFLFDEKIKRNFNKNLDFTNDYIIHISGGRYEEFFKKNIIDELKKINADICKKIENYEW